MTTDTGTTVVPVDGYDVTHQFLYAVPKDRQLAGYLTGGPDVRWTPQQIAAYPGSILLDQSPVIDQLDVTADGLDIERGAATDAEAPRWLADARQARQDGRRRGQRDPAFYRSLDAVPGLSAVLHAAGYTSGIPLYLAHWGITRDAAVALLGTEMGVFIVVGVQYDNGLMWDYDVWLESWVQPVQHSGGNPPSLTWTEQLMRDLPTLGHGSTGQHVRDVQALCTAHGHPIAVDGSYGPDTTAAVEDIQDTAGITGDGIVGPVTWAVLLDVR